jgi:hypothetical protein
VIGVNGAVSGEPRPYGRQPVALRELSESIAYQLERELRAAGAVESAHLFVKAFWLRAGDERYGWPDYAHAYVWVAPVLMNPKRCEEIEPFLARVRGVTQTGRGRDPPERRNALRPFVFAVVDLQARRAAP